jgi:hypothetical protein
VPKGRGVVGVFSTTASRMPGGGPGAGDFLFARPKRKSPKRKGTPVRRRYLVTSCGIPALLNQPGGLRNSRTDSILAGSSGVSC